MKAGASKRTIRISCVESDPLAVYWTEVAVRYETDLELVSCSLAELGPRKRYRILSVGNKGGTKPV